MDESDPDIRFFDDLGCNHCIGMKKTENLVWFKENNISGEWNKILKTLASIEGEKGHSCILALSGGVDSCNLAYLVHSYGIKPLVVHVDTGWNSALSYRNLNRVLDATGWELETVIIDWEEMRQLQIAFLKSGISNLDVPQDHAIFASLYYLAGKMGHKYILTGGNMASEGIFPSSWHHAAMDRINLFAINKSFGTLNLSNFPTVSFLEYYFVNPLVRRIQTIRPLNYLGYNKTDLSEKVKLEWGIEIYPGKHGESSFTKFFQGYILPLRFGIDKRIAHLSAEIVSGIKNRREALTELEKKGYTEKEVDLDFDFVARRLQIPVAELRGYVTGPIRHYSEFANWNLLQKLVLRIKNILSKLLKRNLSRY